MFKIAWCYIGGFLYKNTDPKAGMHYGSFKNSRELITDQELQPLLL